PAGARRASRDDHSGRHAPAFGAARRLHSRRSVEARRPGRRCVARGVIAARRAGHGSMMTDQARERRRPGSLPRSGFAAAQTLFSYGFRPFFLLGAAWAVLALIQLAAALAGRGWAADALPLFRWHGHEMIFGFVGAAIAGFLLTAAPTWTGTKPIAGTR